jgi:hypothetical protein
MTHEQAACLMIGVLATCALVWSLKGSRRGEEKPADPAPLAEASRPASAPAADRQEEPTQR